MSLSEKDLKVFIDAAKHYFVTVSDRQVSVGTPYLTGHDSLPAQDFTGIIGISGRRKGCVYFTAPRIMMHHLLLSLGEEDIDAVLMRDVVGEVANTLSGNARTEFGPEFMISVPVVIQGALDNIQLPLELMAFVVPLQWQNYSAHLVVCLE